MVTSQPPTRDQEIRDIHHRYRHFYKIAGGLLLILFGIWLGTNFFGDGYRMNAYTEFPSVVATIVVLDRLSEWRDEQRLKRRLVREAGSRANNTAISAVDWMRHEGWLAGNEGLLKGADLSDANLEGADFGRTANLQGAYLRGANLQSANLLEADLQSANLLEADLQGAHLDKANLHKADLTAASLQDVYLPFANLQGAYLRGANLQGTMLMGANLYAADFLAANLQGANFDLADLRWAQFAVAKLQEARLTGANLQGVRGLEDALFDTTTALPDAELIGIDESGKKNFDKYWTPDTDLSRYTDPDHPDFGNRSE